MTKHSSKLTADQFARRMASRLDEGTRDLPRDINERLRAARARATAARLVQAPVLQPAASVHIQNGVGVLHFGDEGLNLWSRIAAFFPLIALVAGLVCVKQFMDDAQADQLAEVDAALLTDDLPPAAYADPGFLQFLKIGDKLTPSETQDSPN